MYIELDHGLVPGKISNINATKILPTGKEQDKKKGTFSWFMDGFGEESKMMVKKYKIQHGGINEAILSQNTQRIKEMKGISYEGLVLFLDFFIFNKQSILSLKTYIKVWVSTYTYS